MTHIPTPEQQLIIEAARKSKASLMVQAYAGCAKSTTLEMAALEMKPCSAIALAFNIKIAAELKARLPEWIEVKTFNSLGNSAWNSTIGKRCAVEKDKIFDLLRERGLADADFWLVRDLVTKARQVGLVPRGTHGVPLVKDTDEAWRDLVEDEIEDRHILEARLVLTKSIEMGYAGIIDYDDQIYLSSLFGGLFKKYKLVLVDEAQDLSTLNIRQVKRLVEDRLIVVGDRNQSIYGFRGSDSNSFDKLRELRPDWLDFKLSVTFRCPRAVVRRRNAFLPDFRAHPSNPEGAIHEFRDAWAWSQIPRGEVAILCRNNAPLVAMSFKLMAMGVPFHFLGRENGTGLATLARRVLPLRAASPDEMLTAVEDWRLRETAAAQEAGKVSKLPSIHDRADALAAIIKSAVCSTRQAVIDAAKKIYAKEGGAVTLSTAHKFKGLESETVLHLDPWRVPSRFAETAEELIQEKNILNVIETRAKLTLLTASLDNFIGV